MDRIEKITRDKCLKNDLTIVMAEDDEGHATLIKRNLLRTRITNKIIQFKDGRECLDFFFRRGDGPQREDNVPYILLLDIKMPLVNGIEVLQQMKATEGLREIPVIMLTTTDDPVDVENCYNLGCANYIEKPVGYNKFVETIEKLGSFIMRNYVPMLNS